MRLPMKQGVGPSARLSVDRSRPHPPLPVTITVAEPVGWTRANLSVDNEECDQLLPAIRPHSTPVREARVSHPPMRPCPPTLQLNLDHPLEYSKKKSETQMPKRILSKF
ncbi:hypothetical protein AVEN_258351-1 [Araneus ventricosus]|uniref:Uncharacterized protein n=1 Tax=Araneus ventricosus TaxID=182803 RepID=A0A4Y2WNC6_ARAVE|nr:hypothetical protein AVEN_265554-1 [Araneus ventricosus]GBO38649.1 hypothetical protein AVEN_258351-1 [Araneus ventricosus]